MPNIVAHIGRTLAGHSVARIADVRAQLVYNFGQASALAAEQLAEIYAEEQARVRPQSRSVGTRWRQLWAVD